MPTSHVDHCTITIEEQHSNDYTETEEDEAEISCDKAEECITALTKFSGQNSCFNSEDYDMLLTFKNKLFAKKFENRRLQKIRKKIVEAIERDHI